MTDFDCFVANVTRRSVGVFAVALAASIVAFRDDLHVAAGLALGFAVGLVVFRLKAKAALVSAGRGKKRGAAFLIGRHYLNLVAYAAVLAFAFKTGEVNGWAVLAGLLAPNAVMIVGALFGRSGATRTATKQAGEL